MKMRCSFLLAGFLPAAWVAASTGPQLLPRQQDGGSGGGNLSLRHPELFSLHWQMLEKNSTSGFETPMVDFLSGYLEDKGLTVELQPVQNPILA